MFKDICKCGENIEGENRTECIECESERVEKHFDGATAEKLTGGL